MLVRYSWSSTVFTIPQNLFGNFSLIILFCWAMFVTSSGKLSMPSLLQSKSSFWRVTLYGSIILGRQVASGTRLYSRIPWCPRALAAISKLSLDKTGSLKSKLFFISLAAVKRNDRHLRRNSFIFALSLYNAGFSVVLFSTVAPRYTCSSTRDSHSSPGQASARSFYSLHDPGSYTLAESPCKARKLDCSMRL